jgi:hypothetical protein
MEMDLLLVMVLVIVHVGDAIEMKQEFIQILRRKVDYQKCNFSGKHLNDVEVLDSMNQMTIPHLKTIWLPSLSNHGIGMKGAVLMLPALL